MALITLLAIVGWAYADHRTAGFVYEDRQYLDLARADSSWRPVTVWTWQLAPTPIDAHALNLGLHFVVAALLGWVVWLLGHSYLAAWAATAILLVHPLAVQSVAYAVGRAELLAAIGVLAACLSALKGRWILAGWCLLFGWLSKESAIVGIPLVLLVAKPPRIAWALGALVLGGVVLDLGGWSAVVNLGEMNDATVTAGSWLLVQATAAIRLIALSLFVGVQTVDFDYDVVPHAARVLSLALLGALAVVAWVYRARPLVGVGLAWTLIALVPRLIVQTPKSYLNEHQFLMPLLGLIIAGAGLVKR